MADKTIILSKDPSQLCQEIPLIEGDNNTYVIRFVAPRYSGGVDLANLTWGVNIKNATLEQGFVNLSSATSDDSAVYIDWNVGSFATVLHGSSFCTIEGRNNSSSAHPVWKSSIVTLRVGRSVSADDIIDGSDIDSITEIAENVAESIVNNSVRYDTSQSLNSTQKTTARTNIGAVSQAEVQQAVAAETSAREAAVAAEATAREAADNDIKSAIIHGDVSLASEIWKNAGSLGIEYDGLIYTNGLWLISTGKHVLLPVSPGDSVYIKANSSNSTIYAVLKDYISAVRNQSPLYSDDPNYNTRKTISANAETGTPLIMPSDAKYLCLNKEYTNSESVTSNYMPAILTINGYDAYVGVRKAIVDSHNKLYNNRQNIVLNPLGGFNFTGLESLDFRDMPVNSYAYLDYSLISAGFADTNMPDNDWAGTDVIGICRDAVSHLTTSNMSIITLYNFTKTRKLQMLYFANASTNKYRWIVPTTDLTKQYQPADAKAVGDALSTKVSMSSLTNNRQNIVLNPLGGFNWTGLESLDFRDMPVNSYAYLSYSLISAGFADTNMPDNDWAGNDSIVICRDAVSHLTTSNMSIITLYNFTKTRKLQMLYFANASTNKYRWLTDGLVNNNTINYTINQYANEYNVTATPAITTDTNNYLHPTGDNTDMSSAIVTMLTQSGVCNLAPGIFYVSGIDMPPDTMIRGSGANTRIILLDSVTDGYAIKMDSRCIVDSVRIVGSTSTPSITSEIGTRNGIIWQGNATATSPVGTGVPTRGIISNCYIHNFTGSGILCHGTGMGIDANLNIINTYVFNSTVGINIFFLSEFHKITNVGCRGCYYGVINNGGNNVFENCNFSKNIIGLLMDNEYGQSVNNSHGAFNNCMFHHCGSNDDGVGIHIIGCQNSELFTSCLIGGGSSILIENSKGIVFSGCYIPANSGGITINGGGLVLFNGCTFGTSLTSITKTNNTATRFNSCYLNDGTVVNPFA